MALDQQPLGRSQETCQRLSRTGVVSLVADELGRNPGSHAALILLSLRTYRVINTTFGYGAGEEFVQQVGTMLQAQLRPVARVAQLGGGEIAVVLAGLKNPEHALLAVAKVRRLLTGKLRVGAELLGMNSTLGVAVFPAHAATPEGLVQRADVALGTALKHGKPFVPATALEGQPDSALLLAQELEAAIAADDLTLYYQPKVALAEGRICGVEALSRWRSPTRGFVSPDRFVTVAEEHDLIKPLTLWSLNVALKHARDWSEVWPGASVAVNLSAALLADAEITALVQQALNIWDVVPDRLTLEVTESAIMEDPERSLATLGRLREIGVGLAIDDFGTGYSSFNYLRKLPVDELKIDKSFVLGMLGDPSSAKIVKAVVDLGHTFGLKIVAEGVEDTDTVQALTELGCDCGQGYHYARALPAEDLRQWLASPRSGLLPSAPASPERVTRYRAAPRRR